MSSRNAADLIAQLALQPHPEGGWYREIYRSPTKVETGRGARSALTTIYYLLESNQLSRWHVVRADELWHYYSGAPLELLAYSPGTRNLERRVLGPVSPGSAAADAFAGTPEADVARIDLDLASTMHLPNPPAIAAPGAGGDVGYGGERRGTAVVSVVPAGVWQAARSLGDYTLVGCTVGPGFEFGDFEFVAAQPTHRNHFVGDLAAYASLL